MMVGTLDSCTTHKPDFAKYSLSIIFLLKSNCILFHCSSFNFLCYYIPWTIVLPVILYFLNFCTSCTIVHLLHLHIKEAIQNKTLYIITSLSFLFFNFFFLSFFPLHTSHDHHAFPQNYSVIFLIFESPWDGPQWSQTAIRSWESYFLWILEQGKKKKKQSKKKVQSNENTHAFGGRCGWNQICFHVLSEL